jgi:hypothetical protein
MQTYDGPFVPQMLPTSATLQKWPSASGLTGDFLSRRLGSWDWVSDQAYLLCVRQRGTKTYRTQRAAPVYQEVNLARPALCFPQRLAFYQWRPNQADVPAAGERSAVFQG